MSFAQTHVVPPRTTDRTVTQRGDRGSCAVERGASCHGVGPHALVVLVDSLADRGAGSSLIVRDLDHLGKQVVDHRVRWPGDPHRVPVVDKVEHHPCAEVRLAAARWTLNRQARVVQLAGETRSRVDL